MHFSAADCESLGISERDASRIIHAMQTNGLLIIKIKSTHNDFSRFWELTILPKCLNYFDDKKEGKRNKRRKTFSEIRAWIALIVSVIAIVLSCVSIYFQFFHKESSTTSNFSEEAPQSESNQVSYEENQESLDCDISSTKPNLLEYQ